MIDDVEIDAVARRLAHLLSETARHEPLMDATEAARWLGVSRATVYAKANELGAVRLGAGPKARLRFDPVRIQETVFEGPSQSGPPSRQRGRRRRRRQSDQRLLPIRGRLPQ